MFTELKPGQGGARMRWAEKPAAEENADTTTTNGGGGGGGRGSISPGGLASVRRTGEGGKRIARGKLNRTMAALSARSRGCGITLGASRTGLAVIPGVPTFVGTSGG